RAARFRSMSIPNDLEVEHPLRPRRRWWLRLLLGALSFIVAVVIVGVICYKLALAGTQRNLDAMIAELDATDPLWRLEDIEAARKTIPDDENAAIVVKRSASELPQRFPRRSEPGHPPPNEPDFEKQLADAPF